MLHFTGTQCHAQLDVTATYNATQKHSHTLQKLLLHAAWTHQWFCAQHGHTSMILHTARTRINDFAHSMDIHQWFCIQHEYTARTHHWLCKQHGHTSVIVQTAWSHIREIWHTNWNRASFPTPTKESSLQVMGRRKSMERKAEDK